MEIRYQVELCINKDYRCLHLSEDPAYHGSAGDCFSSKDAPPEIKALAEIRGVVSLYFKKYYVRVEKGSVFDWDIVLNDFLAEYGKVMAQQFNVSEITWVDITDDTYKEYNRLMMQRELESERNNSY